MTLFDQPGAPPDHARTELLEWERARRRRRGRIVAAIAAAAAAAALLIAAPWDPQRGVAITDTVTVWLSPSPVEVQRIADEVGMSEEGRRIFLASSPRLEGAEAFNEHCPVGEHATLGCYTRRTIYLYRVTDERLAGTNEVTAAHEMLHAAWDRLPKPDRERIGAELRAFVATLPPDHKLFEALALYDEKQELDELHSRVGTEFTDLPPSLEQHYARYFDDRALVLAHYATANEALDAADARIASLTAELDQLGASIDSRRASWEAESHRLNDDIDAYNAAGWTPDSDREYAELNDRVDALEAERSRLSADIDRYNGLVAQLQSLSASAAALYDQLDSMAGARTAP